MDYFARLDRHWIFEEDGTLILTLYMKTWDVNRQFTCLITQFTGELICFIISFPSYKQEV